MPTFKVVLDGIELSEDQSRRISHSIQRAVLSELADHGAEFDHGGRPSGFAWHPISKGKLQGAIGVEPPDEDVLAKVLSSEFGG
jgi:hypothetical protein